MIRDYFGMHRTCVLLFLLMLLLIIVLATRAIEVNRRYLCGGANRERRRTDKDKNPFLHVGCMFSVVAAVSAATACANASGTAAATAKDSRPRKLSGLVRLERAEREREGSAAKSIQRTNAHWAAPCRETEAPALFANTQ